MLLAGNDGVPAARDPVLQGLWWSSLHYVLAHGPYLVPCIKFTAGHCVCWGCSISSRFTPVMKSAGLQGVCPRQNLARPSMLCTCVPSSAINNIKHVPLTWVCLAAATQLRLSLMPCTALTAQRVCAFASCPPLKVSVGRLLKHARCCSLPGSCCCVARFLFFPCFSSLDSSPGSYH